MSWNDLLCCCVDISRYYRISFNNFEKLTSDVEVIKPKSFMLIRQNRITRKEDYVNCIKAVIHVKSPEVVEKI